MDTPHASPVRPGGSSGPVNDSDNLYYFDISVNNTHGGTVYSQNKRHYSGSATKRQTAPHDKHNHSHINDALCQRRPLPRSHALSRAHAERARAVRLRPVCMA